MALAQITNPFEDYSNMRPLVYYKWRWSEPWKYAPNWEPLSGSWKAAPQSGSAMFQIRYGSGWDAGYWPLENNFILPSYTYCYVQIRGLWYGWEYIIWTGVIPVEHFSLLGRSGSTYSADQIIEAYGLDWLLESRLEGAIVQPVGGGDRRWIDHLPTFNKRHEYGGPIIGNASYYWYGDTHSFIFADDGYAWTNWDILEYLLYNYQPDIGPFFRLSAPGEIVDALLGTVGVYDFNNMTLRQAVNILLSPARGLSWTYFTDWLGGVTLVPFSLLAESINFGGFVMPGNYNRTSIDLWNRKEMEPPVITSDIRSTYDAVVVRGEKMKSCFTIYFFDGSLQKAWSDAEETAYKNAAENTPDYSKLLEGEKAELNDKFRSTDKFSRVFTTFRIPRNWDWTVLDAKYIVNPRIDNNGKLTNEQANYWNVDKRILNSLPFLAGWDYTGWNPVDNTAEGAEPEFQKLLVTYFGDNYKYQLVDTLKPYGASIRPLEREMAIEIKFSPAYLAAKNHMSGMEPGMYDGDMLTDGVDYVFLLATVFLETDQLVQVWYNLNNFENKRILEIDIPHAELWYVEPSTIIGVDANGDPQFYNGPGNIKDDTDLLQAVLAAALAWYGRRHNKVSLRSKVLCPGLEVGTLIDNLDVSGIGAMGTVVTEVNWDFRNMTTSVSTDFAEPEIERIFELKKSRGR